MKVFATFLALLLGLSLPNVAPAAAAKKTGNNSATKTVEKAANTSSGKSNASKPGEKKPGINDSLWLEALAAHESGNASEATRLLRLCRLAGVNIDEVENLLKAYIGKEISTITNGRGFSQLSEKELRDFLALQNEICSFRSSSADDWRQLIEVARAFKGSQQFAVAGEALLDRINAGMPIKPDEQWIKTFKDLEKLMSSNTQVLYRLQLFRILAGIDVTAAEYRPQVENMTILARANAARIIGKADVAMALGDLEAAAGLLEKVREFDAQYPDLERAFQRLKRAGEIQRLTGLVTTAMRDRLYLEAKRLCGEIQKIDKNNAFARTTIQQIDEISSRGPVTRQESAEDRILLAIRKFEAELRKADQEQDILQVRAILKELLLLKSDNPEWVERLAAVENEIAVSALNADENFKQATRLFNEERFAELGLFLNRNPGLMNSIDTMVQVWEMRLMANFHSGRFTAAQLKESAEAIIGRAGQSFFASFVLMKLELADNRIAEARVHYQNAVKINPKYQGLRWPGWLLWAHGDGRWAVVLMLIVVLIVLIQLLRPAMALYESTYWLRVGLLAKIFPSLALRSLENCFGIYRDGGDRVKLFRLLVRCCNATGDKKKAMMYASNLHELVPGDPLAKAMGFATSPAADEKGQATASDAAHMPDASHGKLLKAHSDPETAHKPSAGPAGAISLGAIKSRRKSEEAAASSDETADSGFAPAEEPAGYDEAGPVEGQPQYADSYGYDQAEPGYDGAAPEAGGYSQEPGSHEQWPENAYDQTVYENEQYQQPLYQEGDQPSVSAGEDGYSGHEPGYEQQGYGYESYSEAPADEALAQGDGYSQQFTSEDAGDTPGEFAEPQNYNGEYVQPEQYDNNSEASEVVSSEVTEEEHVPGGDLNTEAEVGPTVAAVDQTDYEDEPEAASENLFNDLFVSPPRRRAEPVETHNATDAESIAEPADSGESNEDWSLSSADEDSGSENLPEAASLNSEDNDQHIDAGDSASTETPAEELQPIAYTEEYSHEDFPEDAAGDHTVAGAGVDINAVADEESGATDAELQPIAYTEEYSRTEFAETSEPVSPAGKDKLDYDEFESVIPKYCCNKDLPANEITISPDEVSLDEVRELLVDKPAETAVIDLDAEPVLPVPSAEGEILAVTESAPVFNVEDSIRETRTSLFAELDATNPPAETSKKWREALRQPADSGDLFKDL